jgi:hypothetical protein
MIERCFVISLAEAANRPVKKREMKKLIEN